MEIMVGFENIYRKITKEEEEEKQQLVIRNKELKEIEKNNKIPNFLKLYFLKYNEKERKTFKEIEEMIGKDKKFFK
jgi:hypothetical protein